MRKSLGLSAVFVALLASGAEAAFFGTFDPVQVPEIEPLAGMAAIAAVGAALALAWERRRRR